MSCARARAPMDIPVQIMPTMLRFAKPRRTSVMIHTNARRSLKLRHLHMHGAHNPPSLAGRPTCRRSSRMLSLLQCLGNLVPVELHLSPDLRHDRLQFLTVEAQPLLLTARIDHYPGAPDDVVVAA